MSENWLQSTCQTIESYTKLARDWDTYGGEPASQVAVDFAITFLTRFVQQPFAPLPSVAPISTGVYLEWRLGKAVAYLEIDAESVLFSAINPGTDLYYDDPSFNVELALNAVQVFLGHHSPRA